MEPQTFYTRRLTALHKQLKQIKKQRNLVTIAKLSIFGCMIFQLYWFISYAGLPVIFPILSIGLFILLTKTDTHIVHKQRLITELIKINQSEMDYLKGNLSPFSSGEEFLQPSHPYAADLDIFGEQSLFCHLNRTISTRGTRQLADWLLNPPTSATLIRDRQQTVDELSQQPEWCQEFRAQGTFSGSSKHDLAVLKEWQQRNNFFRHVKQTKILLYTGNILTICAWTATAVSTLHSSIALILSFSQLLIIACLLNKINRYHNQLNGFIHIISHFLPLAHLLNGKTFRSPIMKDIKNSLFASGKNALQALDSLNKIQDSLDQRGNVLVTFIADGLYMKDLHTLLRLEKWKKKHAPEINSWIESIATVDALVSMANYRFNHPDYIFPTIDTDIPLKVEAVGHPLMEGKPCVLNDFEIRHEHLLFIVTGANMAGKSTFLRTIGVNLVLALSGNVVRSKQFIFRPTALFTSMRTTDNLSKDTSYFHAELLRLKQLIDLTEKEEHTFVILDEMLKGTNSVDKLNGSLAFLEQLYKRPVAGLVATHDLALGELATEYPTHFSNVCFEITHTEEEIHYDYKLHKGISNTMNASILLKQMGLI